MRSIEIIDEYTIRFNKPRWSENDISLARCLNMVISDNISADIRIVSKRALFSFIKNSMASFALSKETSAYRNEVYSRLKIMYENWQSFFFNNYITKADYGTKLYEHQRESISEICGRRATLLSLDMGLGKTITSATVSRILSIQRTIIICPALVKWNWFKNMTEDWGYNPMYWTIYDKNKAQMIKAFRERFAVINYEMIPKYFNEIIREDCGHIIIDESHYIKNTDSKRFKAVKKLVDKFPNAKITMLTGTPITNRVNDLFAYCKIAGHPVGDNYELFKKNYCVTSATRGGKKVIGAKNIPELSARMSNFMIRKKAEECLDLPPLIINKYYIDTEDMRDAYDKELEELYSTKMGYDRTTDEKEKAQLKIKMRANLHSLNRIVATAKIETITELIDKIRDEGRKVIVFSSYTAPLEGLQAKYKDNSVLINGSVSPLNRDKLITKFIKEEDCFLFLGNVKAGGIGINLVNANDVIFMNFPFTPDLLEQPYKRAHRIGQTKPVNVYYTIGKDTIDENIFNIVKDKTRDINKLVDNQKKGVVDYDNIQDRLFKDLFNKKGLKV
jgi:SWI/SNF-related matrix-associated actin-dependent regulator of chromatin subfamily A-like protein 1